MFSKLVVFVCAFLILCTSRALCEHCTTEPNPAPDGGFQKCRGLQFEKNITQDHAEVLLKGHETYQQLLYSKKASWKWDSDLEYQAQDWANQCLDTNDGCRNFDAKYKNVYQLIAYDNHGMWGKDAKFTKVATQWFYDLAKDEARRTSINFGVIDRIGCGYTVAMKNDCRFGIHTCNSGNRTYLVCRYAAASESISSPQKI